ncbi:hypothetical protein Daus18300_008397 [Diaporthe australafricana]|uniref:Uncharacterized protein n=1 Tax=Diaporthe australafricana TaxID=127596 RepID=A0ABR3WIX5_9PEZI
MDTRSPATPNTPYGQQSQYKVNVNRQKTRKWVEAKAQNYDGDDWGGDDEFDEYDANDTGGAGGRQDYFNQPQQAQRPGRLTAGLRAVSNSGPPTPGSGSAGSSPSLRPSERIALEKQAAGNRSASGPPALHIQTSGKTPTQPPPQVAGPPGLAGAAASQFPPRKSSMTSQERPDLTNADARPPRTSSRPESPANAARSPLSATGTPKFIRPSDIYKRMEEEKEKERRSMESAGRPSLDSLGGRSGDDSDTTNARRRPSFGRNDEGDANRSLRPNLDTVAERQSEYGFDGLMINPAEPAPPNPTEAPSYPAESRNASLPEPKPRPEPSIASQPQPPTLHHPQALNVTGTPAEPVKRYSTSPKLPLLSRLSGFGGDFFSGGMGFASDSPKSSEPTPTRADTLGADETANASRNVNDRQSDNQQTPRLNQAKPSRPSFPGAWVSETATTPGEMATPFSNIAAPPGDVPSISESPEDVHLKPAPLRTPSPGSASAFSAHDEQHPTGSGRTSPANHQYLKATAPAQGDSTRDFNTDQDTQDKAQARRDMTPIAPLQPRKGSFVEESSEQPRNHPITRIDTVSTADNASPLKESDVLRDEIMRSLSPVRPSDGHMEPPRDESATRESAYLNDVYGDYWTGDDKPPEVEIPLNQHDVREAEPTPVAKDEATDATPRPPAHAAFETATTGTTPPAIPASEPEPVMLGSKQRERFSWEAGSTPGGGNSSQASPTKQATNESRETLTSPISAARHEDPTSPDGDGRGSPLMALPSLNFGDSDISPQVVSAVSTHPPGQANPASDTQSPQSNISGQDAFSPTTDEGANKHLDPSEDKMLVQSPMSPLSPMEPIPIADDDEAAQQRATSPPPTQESPEGVPLPRSPSPTQQQTGPSADNKRHSQTAYNSMSLKQTLQLPTADDRVQKMQETRDHFAALETGLASWLADMAAAPAHENAMASYGYALSGDDAELWGTKGGAVRIPLNAPAGGGEDVAGGAGGPGGGGGAPHNMGRTPSTSINMGNLVMHSGQAGVKGKELLQSAGKMGKGLLSKGKNKLRERAESKRA